MPGLLGPILVVGQRRSDTEGSQTRVVFRGQAQGVGRQIRPAWIEGAMMGPYGPISGDRLPRKASASGSKPPVPQTDTGGQVENTKAIKADPGLELSKSLPFLRF